jgi:hypothetical protein
MQKKHRGYFSNAGRKGGREREKERERERLRIT